MTDRNENGAATTGILSFCKFFHPNLEWKTIYSPNKTRENENFFTLTPLPNFSNSTFPNMHTCNTLNLATCSSTAVAWHKQATEEVERGNQYNNVREVYFLNSKGWNP